MKENKYDDKTFFEQYSRMDRSVGGLKAAGEWHMLEKMLPDFTGKRVLDLGCGFGWHCRYAAEHGASYVLGTDISQNMIDGAVRMNAMPQVEYKVMAIEDMAFRPGSFDIVISSLTFHYLSSFDEVAEQIYGYLTPGGTFVFSAEHPVFTARGDQQWHTGPDGKNEHWPVDNYFAEGRRTSIFLGEEVTKYHKTLTTYINGLLKAGFRIKEFQEARPSDDMLANIPGMQDELRRPMMFLVSAVK